MSYFDDIYVKRVNRFGIDYQSRIQGEREYLFELYLQKSLYLIHFNYNNQTCVGSFEKYKQDNTETLHYLLTRTNLILPAGTILDLPDPIDNASYLSADYKPTTHKWMVYYLEHIKASGYNRYIMLRLTHELNWTVRNQPAPKMQQQIDAGEPIEDGKRICHSWAYMYGQEDNMLKDELRSRSRMDTLYTEALKMSFFIMPYTPDIRKGVYLEVKRGSTVEGYLVTGYDIQSAEGIEYITVDPVYLQDNSEVPVYNTETDNPVDYYWLTQGEIE